MHWSDTSLSSFIIPNKTLKSMATFSVFTAMWREPLHWAIESRLKKSILELKKLLLCFFPCFVVNIASAFGLSRLFAELCPQTRIVFSLYLRHAWCPRFSCKSGTCYPGHYAAMISILIVPQCSSCQAHCFFSLFIKSPPLTKKNKQKHPFIPYPTCSIKKIPPPQKKKQLRRDFHDILDSAKQPLPWQFLCVAGSLRIEIFQISRGPWARCSFGHFQTQTLVCAPCRLEI